MLLSSAAATAPVRSRGVAAARHVAGLAHDALIDELTTWPKPGLVSPVDNGSHDDMSAATLARSAAAIRPFFARMARAGEDGAPLSELRRIGLAAEAAMMAATGGINAHRGAIFSLGLLCAAEGRRGYAPGSADERAAAVARLWGHAILDAPAAPGSHGGRALRLYGAGGAREEAGHGFPAVRGVGIPALRRGREARPESPAAARVECLFALIAHVADTNLLHRGGRAGLAFAQREARRFLDAGGVAAPDWLQRAAAIHAAFVARQLSPGGCADLLAATLFLDALSCPDER